MHRVSELRFFIILSIDSFMSSLYNNGILDERNDLSILEKSIFNIFCIKSSENRYFTTLAGLPTTTAYDGISFATTAPAPIMAPCPTFTPPKIIALVPIHTSLPIVTPPLDIVSLYLKLLVIRISTGNVNKFCVQCSPPIRKRTPFAIETKSPISKRSTVLNITTEISP